MHQMILSTGPTYPDSRKCSYNTTQGVTLDLPLSYGLKNDHMKIVPTQFVDILSINNLIYLYKCIKFFFTFDISLFFNAYFSNFSRIFNCFLVYKCIHIHTCLVRKHPNPNYECWQSQKYKIRKL